MEINCGGDILYFIDVDQETNTLLHQDTENSSNDFDKWLQKNNFVTANDSNIVTLETDPLLSEAQVFDKPNILEGLDTISQSEFVIKKNKIKRTQPTILRSVNNKTDKHNVSLTSNDFINNEILLSKVPKVVEMVFINNSASVVFKDEEGNQVFLTQQLKLPENYSNPERVQKVQKVALAPICRELSFTLPQIITNMGTKIHLCPLRCNKAFLHIADAKLHALKHMQLKPYKCDKPDCPWEFYTHCKLIRHKETHLKSKHFICDIEDCKKGFSTIYNLNEHKKKHRLPAILPCPVKQCEALFQNEKQRRTHYKTHDPSEAPFRCNNGKCPRAFFTQVLLEAHCRSCYQRESEIVCKYPNCGKMFNTPYRLREHIRQHTGAKPYQCRYESCTWRFATASKLKRHQSIHTRERKFHCTIGNCTKSFLRSEHLKDHTLTHIEKRPTESDGKFTSNKKHIIDQNKSESLKIIQEEDISNSNNADILLEQAIQSLGVPSDMILGTGLIPDEPLALLESENFSTVNLRDLD